MFIIYILKNEILSRHVASSWNILIQFGINLRTHFYKQTTWTKIKLLMIIFFSQKNPLELDPFTTDPFTTNLLWLLWTRHS